MSVTSIDERLHDIVRRVNRVRRWLLLLIGLRTLAAAGTFAMVYLLTFSLLDHHLHFGVIGRLTALVLLATGVVSVVYILGRAVSRHYSTRQAANYIERHHSYHQQLVTAVEYFEDKASYPYSKALAERVVVQVDELARDDNFEEVAPKWQAYLSAIVIALAGIAVGIALFSNATYFARYLSRLTQPFATVAPLPATTLESLTGDLVMQPDFSVTLAAAIHGQVPEHGLLHMIAAGAQYAEARTYRDLDLEPASGKEGQLQFASTVVFPVGTYQYQFSSGDAKTEWHTVTVATLPEITGLAAEVKTTAESEPYHQDIREYSLEVLEGSEVKLIAETSEPLSRAVVAGVDGEKRSIPANGAPHFEYTFRADKAGLINFELTNASGLIQERIPALQLTLHADRAPEFKLVNPQGDYLATNVASIPVEVDVSDDYGLSSAELVFEIAGKSPLRVPAKVERGAKSVKLTHTLELEDYDLSLNDSILYHAEATDTPSGIKSQGERAVSDVYLIEVKPYHQVWYQLDEPLPSDFQKQGLSDMEKAHAKLITTLEVARAILKKTWPFANKSVMRPEDRSRIAALAKDVQYNSEQLGKIKADPSYRFSPEHLEILADAITAYKDAARSLAGGEPSKALEPEKRAYQNIRKVLEELEKGLFAGSGGSPPQGPERVKLEEQVHLTRYEKEQTQWELKKLANKLEQLRQEQKQLKERFERFLTVQAQQEGASQQTTDEKSWLDPNAKGDQQKPSESSGGGESSSRITLEGALSPGGAGVGSGAQIAAPISSKPASKEDLLDVMRASQQALQERAEELARTMDTLNDKQAPQEDRSKAREQLAQALTDMKAANSALGDAYFGKGADASKRASDALDAAERDLAQAAFLLERSALLSEQERAAKQLQQQAEAAATLAKALEDATSKEQYTDDLLHLRDAWKHFAEQIGSAYVSSYKGGSPPNFTVLAHSLVPGTDKSKLPDWKDPEQIRAAKWLASQYSTLAIEAERLRGKLHGDTSSDAGFTNVEKQFFERTAAYKQEARR